ncbi:hypothetical protein ACQ4PT_019117 [Festuca glaucescens]
MQTAVSSPVPVAWYPALAVLTVAVGLMLTASFFMTTPARWFREYRSGCSSPTRRQVSPALASDIEAVDRNIIVLTTTLLQDLSRIVYLIYDSVKGSLHMIPAPESPSWVFTGLTVRVLLGRPSRHGSDDDYALVLAGKLEDVPGSGRLQDALLLWRPISSSSPPWSKIKKACFPADMVFSYRGRGLWVDLQRGISYCDLDALFDNYNHDDDLVVAFGFTHLPVKPTDQHRGSRRVPEPKAFRTIGVTQKSFLKFVSIDGFREHVELRTAASASGRWVIKGGNSSVRSALSSSGVSRDSATCQRT